MRTFSETERAAMAKALVDFQREANERYGEEAHFNAEIIPELKRRLGATALEELARAEWQESREKAGCWKSCIATYLKAWADNLNPWTLIEITEILIYEGYKGEAKRVLNVLKQFPEYARAQKNDGFSSDEWVAKLQKRIDDISKDFDL